MYDVKFIPQILKLTNNKVCIALSSGCDSVSIAHFLKTKYPKIELSAFHYDHCLRPQNNDMLQAASKFCKDFDITFDYDLRDVRMPCDKSESALRTLRYKAMAGLGYVITGHHLDDATENYLYNCFSGTPEYLPIPLITEYEAFNLTIIRPFILTEKEDMRKYISDNKLESYIVEDETNVDEQYRRNWLRNNLIPQINEKGYNLKTVVRKRYEKHIKEKL